MWNREGQAVAGIYCDRRVEGVVTSSRVKYGGSVQHTVDLNQPLELFGTTRTTVLLDERDLLPKYNTVDSTTF